MIPATRDVEQGPWDHVFGISHFGIEILIDLAQVA
jgi:hypothetical protein